MLMERYLRIQKCVKEDAQKKKKNKIVNNENGKL